MPLWPPPLFFFFFFFFFFCFSLFGAELRHWCMRISGNDCHNAYSNNYQYILVCHVTIVIPVVTSMQTQRMRWGRISGGLSASIFFFFFFFFCFKNMNTSHPCTRVPYRRDSLTPLAPSVDIVANLYQCLYFMKVTSNKKLLHFMW